ncbi:hypothetical protein Clacol_000151 [Clathrus columnatus]|uniref:Acyl-CoA oxidase C-alpha1 domain-containing protein n=1 Tax=Clathrus columnatus TaxID=1419009 RepID=A0AAV4ZZX9_9AGAM|nr:hypothetical protein Clacol_000151 [Clathrus columnatus]
MQKTAALAKSPLFQETPEDLSFSECIKLSYCRAKAVAQVFKLTTTDILHVSPRYWEFHTDPILVMDDSVVTLLTIQYNLFIGTIARFAKGRPDIEKTISEALDYRISGQFCLTEIDRGLNAINIETTATLQPSGEFLLHTPHPGAAKLLSPRGTARPVGHSLTSFNQVCLPSTALLGSLEKPRDTRESFFQNIQRVVVGTLSMGASAIAALRIGCYIGIAYSLRRQVNDTSTRTMRPISSFSTQYIPLLTSVAQTMVFSALCQEAYEYFVDPSTSPTQKHFVAAIFKTTVFRHAAEILLQLGDRCGAQGLFEVNQLLALHAGARGGAIAEGDILGLSIRFAIDMLRSRVKVPEPKFPDHLLAKHEQSIVKELRMFLAQSTDHRSPETERVLLPHCRGVLEAIGYRWAYEAALAKGVSQPIIDLFIASLFELDAAWYSENAGLPRWEQKNLLLDRATVLYKDLPQLLKSLDVESYVTAPIVSQERWDKYTLSALPCYE